MSQSFTHKYFTVNYQNLSNFSQLALSNDLIPHSLFSVGSLNQHKNNVIWQAMLFPCCIRIKNWLTEEIHRKLSLYVYQNSNRDFVRWEQFNNIVIFLPWFYFWRWHSKFHILVFAFSSDCKASGSLVIGVYQASYSKVACCFKAHCEPWILYNIVFLDKAFYLHCLIPTSCSGEPAYAGG